MVLCLSSQLNARGAEGQKGFPYEEETHWIHAFGLFALSTWTTEPTILVMDPSAPFTTSFTVKTCIIK